MEMARVNRPKYHFAATDSAGFSEWKSRALPEVLATIGEYPASVEPDPRLLCEWRECGLRRQKWLIDVGPFISATVLVNHPELPPGGKAPAIFCCHGHGAFAKDVIMGDESTDERAQNTREHNYDYGRQMAQKGYVTYAIDWIGFGDRNDSKKPNHRAPEVFRGHWCNYFYLHATMLGMTPLSINVAHGKAATNFVCGLGGVDGSRLGVMGLSGGGTMTVWMTLCDERFAASEIICYSDLWAHFGIRDLNYCGMQVAPGLFRLVDLPELQGLIAPRPLLVNIGVHDECFKIDTAMECQRRLEKIYAAAGAADRLELDLHGGGHGWGGNRSEAFFGKFLA